VEKVALKSGKLEHFSNKTAQSKQSPNKRKFAQSGHPAAEPRWLLLLFV
jgi:hypothetical protein